ncbi:MAG: DUF4062 domain-containing protein, partial [Desulfobacterales bacterium]|nr:DUF4062 domain-containing protein [Desulfobacterales bacterium]
EIFPASTRPVVEECLRCAREADILLGIIAWRYGWEPDGKKSITEMEYDAARERLMFLLDPSLPVTPDEDFDPGQERWKKQEKLEAFKKRFAKDQTLAHFTETTLQSKVHMALNQWRDQREGRSKRQAPGEASSPVPRFDSGVDEEIRSYCRKAESRHANLSPAGFATPIKLPIEIEDIYVPLRAMIDLRGVADERFMDSAHAEKRLKGIETSLELSLPEAFRQSESRGHKGLVILGDPGSGKTTHMKRLLLWLLRSGPETLGLPEGMLPVYLPLMDLKDLDNSLDDFIQDNLSGNRHLKTPEGFGERLLKR